MTFELLAARLAGGLAQPVDDDALREAITAVLPETALGELDGIKALPGMVGAAADTLRKAWRAGVDLQGRAAEHPRLQSIANLEAAVVETLPPAMMRPADLVAAGVARLDHAATLFGPVEIVGITELSPVWRPLLHALAGRVPIRWIAGPRPVPDWLDGDAIQIAREKAQLPGVFAISAATAYHEAVEAMRWARQLLASGGAEPVDIAIASATPADYDDHLLALRADASLDLHFVHGVKVTASREGQAAAALADILLRGLSQTRMRRLNTLLRSYPGPFADLPESWTNTLPAGSPLSSPEAWGRLLDRLTADDWPDGRDHGLALAAIVGLLSQGVEAAEQAGETLLYGQVHAIWRKALAAGAAASLDLTLETLKQDDGLDPCVSVCWMPASALAASPRRFVRLLGLNSARWPRPMAEDRLLSDHIVPTAELDPLPVAAADRRDFATILATTESEIVLSRARRDEEGRLLGRSTLLLQVRAEEDYLPRNRLPLHAFSETDRLMARPEEFRAMPQAAAATGCWFNWLRAEITPHDGAVRPDHPLIHAVLERTQSASSLRMLLRNPLGFVWHYGLGWRAPESGEDPLTLDALAMGNLVHQTLDGALRTLEADGGVAHASDQRITAAVSEAATEVAGDWESERAVPPPVIWHRTLDEVRALGSRALAFRGGDPAGARAYGEVPFGGAKPKSDGAIPWDPEAPVAIPDTNFRIRGYIDRLDISADGRHALVRDYKTGKAPKNDIVLDGGRELQRCLYAFAVKAMLGDGVVIAASLLYPRDERDLRLDDPDAVLGTLTGHLQAARANLASGGAVMGEDTGNAYDELAFALPANAGAIYRPRKDAAAVARLGDAAQVWDAA
ncbi:MAG: PD-(D/E)XK nuclease family protein [Rhodospirillales bacterium]|nr:PD-(D/E)XK nuclease family protein [Rhodospirillales bacterium]MDE0377870.1 PD-(D/E)XK nuclease family protein [Rhodospirillales bacterium]